MVTSAAEAETCLVIRVDGQLAALPLRYVSEIMRPQPVRPVPAVPAFVSGAAVIRGAIVPVVNASSLLFDSGGARPRRFVLLNAGDRRAALAVDDVVGVRAIGGPRFAGLPPLLSAAREPVVSAIGTLDSEVLIVLRAGRLVPQDVWAAIEAGEPDR